MGWQVIIAPSAQSDLADIVRYIARHNSDAAARLGFELITRAESLTQFPEIGRTVPEFRLPDLREIICRSYRIIYRLKREDKQIQIVASGTARGDFPIFPAKSNSPRRTDFRAVSLRRGHTKRLCAAQGA